LTFFVRHGGHCCHPVLVGRTNFWIILCVLLKLEQRAKKCTELPGCTLNKSGVWSLELVSFMVGLRTYQLPLVRNYDVRAIYT
jgi:hypothetical protein